MYMIMQLRSGHVTLLNFNPLSVPQSDLRRRAASRWALPHISSYSFKIKTFFAYALLSFFVQLPVIFFGEICTFMKCIIMWNFFALNTYIGSTGLCVS